MNAIEWVKVIPNKINFTVLTKVSPTKGNITYEYNPFHNYRILLNMYEYNGGLYSLGELWDKFRVTLKYEITKDADGKYLINSTDDVQKLKETGKVISEAFQEGNNRSRLELEKLLKKHEKDITQWWDLYGNLDSKTNPVLREAGEITDFITNELDFDLEHPVEMLPLYSYDGSVNLILNDGKNNPKLINSRFSATGKNTYEVCDRKGNNDTNIYDLGENFEIDTSLYKLTTTIAQLLFKGVDYGGVLKVGNYNFYFKLADADGNESDFIAESGLVSVFLGLDSYKSVSTGARDLVSHKKVSFVLSNLDTAYDYVHVYYSRSSAEGMMNRVTEYVRIDKNYPINNAHLSNILITGYETTTNVTAEDINLLFNIVDSAYTSAICLNRLFMANVHKPDIPYLELQDLSLRICPYLASEKYECDLTHEYVLQNNNKGYIDPVYIYNKTGYWSGELYRFGIVYIMPDNTLSPVFNIRGGCAITKRNEENDSQYTKFDILDKDNKRIYITGDEESYLVIVSGSISGNNAEKGDLPDKGSCLFENVKGVVLFKADEDTNKVHYVQMVIPKEVKNELLKYVKGYFFVRLPRIPLVLALGVTIGINKESGTPTIPTRGGVVDKIFLEDLSKTHITVGQDSGGRSYLNPKEVVYASEGFMSRYLFEFKPKSSSIWKNIGKWVGMGLMLAVAAAGTILSLGLGTGVLVVAGIIAGSVIGGGAAIAATVGAILETIYAIARTGGKTFNRWNTIVPSGYKISEIEDSRQLVLDFDKRIILTALDLNYIAGILCPEFATRLGFFNSIFTGNEHLIETAKSLSINILNTLEDNYFTNEDRHFYMPDYFDTNRFIRLKTKVVGLTDDLKIGCIEDIKYRARAGEAEEAFRLEYVGDSFKSTDAKQSDVDDEETLDNRLINSDIIRGSFGPYLAFYDKDNTFGAGETVNIYAAGYDDANLEEYVYLRCCDATTFYTISDRFELKKNLSIIRGVESDLDIIHDIFRGDCYICQYTQRINRNFLDPSAPFNDLIIETNTWKDNYDPANSDKNANINVGDVNAVLLGMWATFRVRSSCNLNIRTEDGSFVLEAAMTNTPRTYYPKTPMSVEGTFKIPESSIFNDGFRKLLGERYNFELPDIPWIKNWYGTRIMYSNINVSDSFLNGFRVFKGLDYRDYTREYGSIIKLISLESSLLCVFEHGVALIPVNERAVAGEGPGGMAYINTSNVLPENPRILSDVFGSQWADSVLKVPGKFGDNVQYVYGVDTVAKKIWRTDGRVLTCISDFRVLEFLNNNITLSQRELTPKIGIRNVKTFYNAFKRDVLFTFYDNTYGFEEKVWNLCWNELMLRFTTFYSWVPSCMENINNIPFSFNRNTTKWIAKLGVSHADNSFADGITLSNVILKSPEGDTYLNNQYVEDYSVPITYQNKEGGETTVVCEVAEESRPRLVGVLSLSNRTLPTMDLLPKVKYNFEKDPWNNRDMFTILPVKLNYNNDHKADIIDKDGNFKLPFGSIEFKNAKFSGNTIVTYGVYLTEEYSPFDLMSEVYFRNKEKNVYSDISNNKISIYSDPNLIELKDKEITNATKYFKKYINYPIFKDKTGKRPILDKPYKRDKLVTLLNIKATITYVSTNTDPDLSETSHNIQAGLEVGLSLIDAGYYESTIALTTLWNLQFLSTDFWKHGLAGIIDITDPILPTYWYGELHPFEFEFIVANEPGKHKIFDNLQIISNKAEPHSFHYEIVGECYDFAKDKKNMYIRQEATKEFYLKNGSDITFNHNYNLLEEKHRPLDPFDSKVKGFDKSTIFPLYYSRLDSINEILDYYHEIKEDGKDLLALAGAELILYKNLQEIRILNHCKAVDIKTNELGRLRGNMEYKEDLWNIQINPINYIENNENDWSTYKYSTKEVDSDKVPIEITRFAIPDDVKDSETGMDTTSLERDKRGITKWIEGKDDVTYNKEVKIKDKYLKVCIRYSGEDLAIINAINTLYSLSFA